MDKSNLTLNLFPDRPVKKASEKELPAVDPNPLVECCQKCGSPNIRDYVVKSKTGNVQTHICTWCEFIGSTVQKAADQVVRELTK